MKIINTKKYIYAEIKGRREKIKLLTKQHGWLRVFLTPKGFVAWHFNTAAERGWKFVQSIYMD